ncbi:proteasome assembly chaperone 2 [Kockiozyma suomiensis]|uniref:proteasome assembly chaperone 2 n=1 Tax=Kockiozyma suomiensis TaxID=1337062 RepID=UPI0033431A4E
MALPNANTVLILPTVSSANVPQLAVDLLVHSLKLPFYSLLDHGGLLYPFAGPAERPEGSPSLGISSSLEIYHSSSVTCIIQRSPTLPASRGLFVSEVLMKFIQQNKFSRILLLSSADASRRQDPDITKIIQISLTDPFSTGSMTSTFSDLSGKIARLSVESSSSPPASESPIPTRIPGSGITIPFLQSALQNKLAVDALVMYAYDGDNIPDATRLSELALETINVPSPAKWVHPLSWDGVYGKEVQVGLEHGLYG